MANLNATLTCPHCGHDASEVMPTDCCIVVYDCPACARTLRPKAADCCVFCSYGNLPVMNEVKQEAARRHLELVLLPTADTIRPDFPM